ncbi:MAG TPA: hypothetical protein VHN19_06480 [Burkholderiales bacterium]|nr:hypothetical protein [Burkholderiales bacterium]
MDRVFRRAVFFLLLLAFAAPAAAMDPILMFVFSVAREMMEANAARPPASKPLPEMGMASLPDFPKVYPGTMIEPAHLRQLIDDCFPYLSDSRRAEIFDALNAELLNPKNAPIRASMIDYFAEKAFAVRAAQQRLEKMSTKEKEFLAGEFKKEVAGLPPEEKARVTGLLREGLLPVPSDFNRMLLGTVESE